MRPAKAIETMMAEQVENIDEETEDLPSDFAHPTKNASISVAELLEDLQDRSVSSVRTPFSVCISWCCFIVWSSQTTASLSLNISMQIHQKTEAKEGKPKVPTSGKKILALLGQRDLDSEEPSEHAIGETSSEDEAEVCCQCNCCYWQLFSCTLRHDTSFLQQDTVRNNLTMVNKDVRGNRKTMSDLFQEAFNATDMEGTALPMRSTGYSNPDNSLPNAR